MRIGLNPWMHAAGRAVITFGVLLCIWHALIWASERQFVATVAGCSEYQQYEGGFPSFPSEPVPRVRCSLAYEDDGDLRSATFDIRSPSDVNKLHDKSRRLTVWISPMTPDEARPLGIVQNLGGKVGGLLVVLGFGWFLVVTSRTKRI